MTALSKRVLVITCLLAVCSCSTPRAEHGGEPEQQLAAATMAGDVSTVSRLLASGANPDAVAQVNGDTQSAWFLALRQVRPSRPELVAIVKAMLDAGANPNEVWGTRTGTVGSPQSAWQRFFSQGGTRQAGFGRSVPIDVAAYPVADVVRALVAKGFNAKDGGAALVNAVETGDAEIVHLLVDAGVDANARPGAITPLVAAIEARNVVLMTYLEEHGARERR